MFLVVIAICGVIGAIGLPPVMFLSVVYLVEKKGRRKA